MIYDSKMINEFLVVDRSGIALFYFDAEGNGKEHQRLASFFTALDIFVKEGFKDSIKMIKLVNKIYYLYPKDNLIFIASILKTNFKEKLVEEFMSKVSEKFLKKFTSNITQFKKDISIFDSFIYDLQELIGKKIKIKKKSSEILKDFLGINKKINYKKVLDAL